MAAQYLGQFDGLHVSARIYYYSDDAVMVRLYMSADGIMRVRTVAVAYSEMRSTETLRDALVRLLVSVA
jgi:hypothetical protein